MLGHGRGGRGGVLHLHVQGTVKVSRDAVRNPLQVRQARQEAFQCRHVKPRLASVRDNGHIANVKSCSRNTMAIIVIRFGSFMIVRL